MSQAVRRCFGLERLASGEQVAEEEFFSTTTFITS